MNQEYTAELLIKAIANMERIKAFLERTTSELFPLYFQIEVPDGYRMSEGHTLEDLSPHSTRVPTKDSLKETLLILICDVERAMYSLDPMIRLELVLSLDEGFSKRKDNEEIELSATCREAVDKMVEFLNEG